MGMAEHAEAQVASPAYEPIHPGSGRGSWRERLKRYIGPIAAGALLLATKLKAILLLLPKVKLLTTSATMVVSIAAYALLWGWQFGVGLVLLLFVHEMGHVIQLRREGIEASAPMFIPFLGAVVAAKSLGDDAAAEARVGLAGPGTGPEPDVGRLFDLFDEVARHVAQRVAAHRDVHVLRVAREMHGRLSGRVPPADHENPPIPERGRLGAGRPVVHALRRCERPRPPRDARGTPCRWRPASSA